MEQIKSIDSLTADDIRRHAQAAYERGEHVGDCPFLAGTDAATSWTKHFIACERYNEDALA